MQIFTKIQNLSSPHYVNKVFFQSLLLATPTCSVQKKKVSMENTDATVNLLESLGFNIHVKKPILEPT